jgi:hypothetical protein
MLRLRVLRALGVPAGPSASTLQLLPDGHPLAEPPNGAAAQREQGQRQQNWWNGEQKVQDGGGQRGGGGGGGRRVGTEILGGIFEFLKIIAIALYLIKFG